MTTQRFVAISRSLLRFAVIRLIAVHCRPLRLARALVVVRQSPVRGCVPRILLERGREPVQTLFFLSTSQQDAAHFGAQGGIVGRLHDPQHQRAAACVVPLDLLQGGAASACGFGFPLGFQIHQQEPMGVSVMGPLEHRPLQPNLRGAGGFQMKGHPPPFDESRHMVRVYLQKRVEQVLGFLQLVGIDPAAGQAQENLCLVRLPAAKVFVVSKRFAGTPQPIEGDRQSQPGFVGMRVELHGLFIAGQRVGSTPQAFRGLAAPEMGLKVVRLQFEQRVERIDNVRRPERGLVTLGQSFQNQHSIRMMLFYQGLELAFNAIEIALLGTQQHPFQTARRTNPFKILAGRQMLSGLFEGVTPASDTGGLEMNRRAARPGTQASVEVPLCRLQVTPLKGTLGGRKVVRAPENQARRQADDDEH